MSEPQEAPYTDEPIKEFSIRAKHEQGFWAVHCPEWKYFGYSNDLTKLVSALVDEIVAHNKDT